MRPTRTPLILLASTALLLSGCATTTAPSTDSADTKVVVVASTSVYGDIAGQIAGDLASVTSLITSSAQDPHSYEASAQDRLILGKAGLVIENGGGYDPFIDTLLTASGTTPTVINASEESGLMDDHGSDSGTDQGDDQAHVEGFNEHVWYSFAAMQKVSAAIAEQLAALDPANSATYQAKQKAFAEKLSALEARADTLKASIGGGGVAITEPVPLYLLEEIGLQNKTPAEFSEAIEEGTDVPPAALQDTLGLFSSASVRLLAYNSQTASPETERVRAAADAAGIPVLSFTETLPEGADYVSWMNANLDALAKNLQG